jgi:chromosome segregation ATPase
MKALEYDHQKTVIRIDETNKCVEARAFDIRNKTVSLQDNENEIGRLREINSNQNVEITALRRDVDRVSTDCYDLRKNIEGLEARNGDVGAQIR